MTYKYFVKYTGIEVKQFRKTLLQYTSNVKKSVAERTRHKRLYDRRVNKRQLQKQESKVDLGKALDAGLVVTKCSGTKLEVQDTSSRTGDDADADNADIKPIYDEEPMAEILEKVLYRRGAEHLKQTYKDRYDSIKKIRVQTKDHNDSLIVQLNNKSTENVDLKAQIQEKVFTNAALKNELRKLKGNIVDTKFAKPSILGKPILQPLKNQSVVRQPNTFKSERSKTSKPWFASQVDVKKDFSKPVTPYYLKRETEGLDDSVSALFQRRHIHNHVLIFKL
ncbi:hypothetical protein Tco_0685873 [Tanacetum coccineum]